MSITYSYWDGSVHRRKLKVNIAIAGAVVTDTELWFYR